MKRSVNETNRPHRSGGPRSASAIARSLKKWPPAISKCWTVGAH